MKKFIAAMVFLVSCLCLSFTPTAYAATQVELNEMYGSQGLLNAYNEEIEWDYKVLAYLSVQDRGRPNVTTYEAASMNGMGFRADQNGQGYVSEAYIIAPDSFSRGNIEHIAYHLLCAANFYGANWNIIEHPNLYNESLSIKMMQTANKAIRQTEEAQIYYNPIMERYYSLMIGHVDHYWLIGVSAWVK